MYKKVSVIITNYNRSAFVGRAVRSCLEQLLFNGLSIEIIVVDDGSTDDSLKILKMFEGSIILVVHEKNRGVAAASNSGLRVATGDFIIRLDADDFMNKLSVHLLSQILNENPAIGFVYTDHYRVDDHGFKQEKVVIDNKELLYEHGAGVMIRREVFAKVGFYDESLKNCEDYDLLVRICKEYNGFHVPLPLYRYHIHGQNISLDEKRDEFKNFVRARHGL